MLKYCLFCARLVIGVRLKFTHAIAPSLAAFMFVSLFTTIVSADGNASAEGNMMMGGQNGNGMGMSGHMWKDGSGFMNGEGSDQDMQERMQEMMQAGKKYGLFDQFTYADGIADGYFVDFRLNETNGMITDYVLETDDGPVAVFERIEIADFAPSVPEVHGAVMMFENDTVQIIVHDNPTAMYHVIANDTETTVSFKVAEGMSVTEISGGPGDGTNGQHKALMISDGEVEGIICTDDGSIVVESGASGTYVNVTFLDDHAMFRAKPTFAHRHMHNEQAMMQAIIQNRMACEISLMVRNGSAVYDIMEYQHEFKMTVMQAERNRITLQVSSENHEGRVILMNMDQLTMETKNGVITVKLDGKTVRASTNPLEVLYATGSNASDAVYTVLQIDDASQVLVYVPSFSTHTLSIESILPGAEIFGIAGIVAVLGAVAVVGGATVVLFVRRK